MNHSFTPSALLSLLFQGKAGYYLGEKISFHKKIEKKICGQFFFRGIEIRIADHLGLSYRFLVALVRVVPQFPSYFFLRVLSKRHMLSSYFNLSLVFVLIIDLE